MREFDTDSDGKLSFTEFQVTMVIRYQRWSLNLLKISADLQRPQIFLKISVASLFVDFQKAVEKLKERESQEG